MKYFQTKIDVRWADCDANRHVRHSAYYDYGAHARIRFFNEFGFSSKRMGELNIGPILFKEECSFIREIKPEDIITISVLKGELAPDASRWVLHHELFNQDGKKCAHITIKGAWMDLRLRKLTIPPEVVAKAFHELSEGEEYVYVKKKK